MRNPELANRIISSMDAHIGVLHVSNVSTSFSINDIATSLSSDIDETYLTAHEIVEEKPTWFQLNNGPIYPYRNIDYIHFHTYEIKEFIRVGGFTLLQGQRKKQANKEWWEAFWKRNPWLLTTYQIILTMILVGGVAFLFQQWFLNRGTHPSSKTFTAGDSSHRVQTKKDSIKHMPPSSVKNHK